MLRCLRIKRPGLFWRLSINRRLLVSVRARAWKFAPTGTPLSEIFSQIPSSPNVSVSHRERERVARTQFNFVVYSVSIFNYQPPMWYLLSLVHFSSSALVCTRSFLTTILCFTLPHDWPRIPVWRTHPKPPHDSPRIDWSLSSQGSLLLSYHQSHCKHAGKEDGHHRGCRRCLLLHHGNIVNYG